ncbi:MAG: hypothetical protein NZ866_00840 [Patescibacteria group bacterium]|nr:hypothetical protein [Patescibacteria group bacterium]
MINKILFNEYFYYLSPLLALLILMFIISYLQLKIKKIKILPKDYLKLYHYERKLKGYFQIGKFYHSTINFFLNFLIKILQRFKTESLKFQIWAEKNLSNLKNLREQKINQEENNLTEDKTS